jgi:ribonuclease P protein component
LFREGKTFTVFPFRISCLYQPGTAGAAPLKFGVGAGTRNFKKAVDRNRIKRLTKEAWRLQKNILQDELRKKNNTLNVFLIYTGKELPDHKTVCEKVHVILEKLVKRIDENNPPGT